MSKPVCFIKYLYKMINMNLDEIHTCVYTIGESKYNVNKDE